jgi:hypothetical protein
MNVKIGHKKCGILKINNKKKKDEVVRGEFEKLERNQGKTIKEVQDYRYLGVIINNKGEVTNHLKELRLKSRRMANKFLIYGRDISIR